MSEEQISVFKESRLAVAAEHNASTSLSPCKAKLILPDLTPAMHQDLVLAKGSGGKAGSLPLSIANRSEFVDYPLTGIVTPHPHDVLCGRGGGSNNHPGNESFRELVNEVKVPYVKCAKREKPLIARRIVEAVRLQTPPGRFLIKDTKSGSWNDIGDGRAREKTSQALREGAPVIRNMSCGTTTPTSPSDLAALVKEAKKAERTEKEYDVTLPSKKRSLGHVEKSSPLHVPNEPNSMVRGTSMGNNSPPNNLTGPDLKNFRSLGEQSAGSNSNYDRQQHQPAREWHHPHMAMPAYAFAPQAPLPPQGTVPLDVVRRLLLGQVDPVLLAMQILSPEDAIAVARLVHQPRGIAMNDGVPPPRDVNNPAPPQLPTSSPVVSDQSTASASSQQGGDDNSSVGSGSKQSNKGKHRALPKKKRKYVEYVESCI